MGKTRKFVPDLRVRRPYRREPKLRTNMPAYEPFDIYDEDEDTQVDEEENETDTD